MTKKHGHTLITILLVAILGLQAYNTFFQNNARDLEVAKVGGEENYQILENLYADEKFAEVQKQSLEAYATSVSDFDGEAAPTAAADVAAPAATAELSDSQIDEILETVKYKGNSDADILLIEFSDVECPFCQRHNANGTVAQVVETYSDDVAATLFHYPLSFHPNAQHAAEALECAKPDTTDTQWFAYLDALFVDYADGKTSIADVLAQATAQGIDATAIQTCLDNGDTTAEVTRQMDLGYQYFGVQGTPGNVLLNVNTGEYTVVSGAQPYSAFSQAIEAMIN